MEVEGIDLDLAVKFSYAYMRRFALGALLYDPERFGKMLVADFIDAMGGYNEAEHERFKNHAELVRLQTAILWNIQVGSADRLKAADLWPFPWDKDSCVKMVPMSEEKRKEIEALHEKILNGEISPAVPPGGD